MIEISQSLVNDFESQFSARADAVFVPSFCGNEKRYLSDCIDSTFVSTVGPFVAEFEAKIAEYTRAKRVIAVVNGTSALHLALKIIGVEANDEVLIPALTFIATANAVTYLGAVPHFVDVDRITLGIDPEALEEWLKNIGEWSQDGLRNRATGRRIRALVPMHTFGNPCEMEGLLAVADRYNLRVVEDAAEGLGSFYRGCHVGTGGQLGCLSFNGNKIITTGGGGAIVTNDDELANYAKHLSTTAKIPHKWEYDHDQIGFNYRLPNLNAALGCAQLEQLESVLVAKKRLHKRYEVLFNKYSDLELYSEPTYCESNHWLETLILSEELEEHRDDILSALNRAGFACRPAWRLLSQLAPFKSCPSAPTECSKILARRIINLPSGAGFR